MKTIIQIIGYTIIAFNLLLGGFLFLLALEMGNALLMTGVVLALGLTLWALISSILRI